MEVHTVPLQDVEATLNDNVRSVPSAEIPAVFASQINLISSRLNTYILSKSDDFFASAQNLLSPNPPIHKPNTFIETGAWYDGWETRRHNPAPFDWVVFRLGVSSAKIHGVEIDTAFFTGNHAPEVSVQGVYMPSQDTADSAKEDQKVMKPDFAGWKTILPKKECGPSRTQAWTVPETSLVTHVRLCMYPDGGIARFRLYGSVVPVFPNTPTAGPIDLAAVGNGGVCTSVSDQHFGQGGNLLLPGRGVDMGDGWETKRSRGVHVDWAVIRLGAVGEIEKVVLDTAHFRGNYPQKVQILGAACEGQGDVQGLEYEKWTEILAPRKVGPDAEFVFEGELEAVEKKGYSHVKLVIIPDGGVKRLRVFGRRVLADE